MNCCNLLQKWLAHYDPIHRGFTARGIANGGLTTVGWFFPRIRGGFNLYRGSPGGDQIDFDHPVGAADADATEIRNFAWRGHQPGESYAYALRRIGGGGVESPPAARLWPAVFDPDGVMQEDPPNSPANLQAEPLSAGRFRLRWTYREVGQFVAPLEFRLYHDDGSGAVDYSTVRGTTPYRFGAFYHEFVSPPFAHEARRRWSVRAASAMGVEDSNLITASAVADAQGPPNHPTAFSECGPES